MEDDDAIAEPLCAGLEREGFVVSRVATGVDALNSFEGQDVVLLDLNLPDIDGLEICEQIRRRADAAVICLTARTEEADRVRGLACADDYIVKPFGFGELVARIGAVTRRRTRDRASALADVTRAGALTIDRRTRRVLVDEELVPLTPKEFDILATLAEDPGAVVSREALLERVWGAPWYGPTKTLDVHVASLRKKLGRREFVEAVRGVGFRLAVDP